MSFVTHLESALDGTMFAANEVHTVHQDRPLWVRYDLDAVARAVTRSDLTNRPPQLWRYRELLPVEDFDERVSLGEPVTPLIRADRLAQTLGVSDLWIKDESRLPTASFKARGMALAVSMARQLGLTTLAVPTAGNAGSALAAYGARAGMQVCVFMPADTPGCLEYECRMAGARVFLVDGLIHDCARIVREGTTTTGWFDMATLREPYRIEGKKTMGLELAEQLEWKLPDVIIYPTGGGTGLIGMWKAFRELRALGWLDSGIMPRMVAVQSAGCAPIVRAFDAGERFASAWEQPQTTAWGIRVPVALGDFMILDAIRESGGLAIAVDEAEIHRLAAVASRTVGLSICPEAGACFAAIRALVQQDRLSPAERIVVFNTASALKYEHRPGTPSPRLTTTQPVNYEQFRTT